MNAIIGALRDFKMPVVFPVHPRTRKYLQEYGVWDRMPENIHVTEPLGYLDMVQLMGHARRILTDSGGVQKEAYMLSVPCITLRENTEWVETLDGGWNVLVGAERERILSAIRADVPGIPQQELYLAGASRKIRELLQMNEGMT
jgi:UDP-N-acetylglucosamine 2-epimerase (non-hydrolysing)